MKIPRDVPISFFARIFYRLYKALRYRGLQEIFPKVPKTRSAGVPKSELEKSVGGGFVFMEGRGCVFVERSLFVGFCGVFGQPEGLEHYSTDVVQRSGKWASERPLISEKEYGGDDYEVRFRLAFVGEEFPETVVKRLFLGR